jgi:hypothetical protein
MNVILFMTSVHSLHDVHNMNTYRADHICLSVCFTWKTAGRILMKFSVNVMLLEATPELYLVIFHNW